MKKVAVFDIDGTIFRSSLLIELVNILIDRKIFPNTADKEYEREYSAWLNREGEYQDYIKSVVNVFMKYVKGVREEAMVEASMEVSKYHQNKVYRYTRDLIKTLKQDGYYLLAISHSPKPVIESFAKNLGFDKIYGVMYEVDPTGFYTGKILDEELIFDKSKILSRAIDKESLTLDNSVGVGDTESDIVFLEKVATPICFNPNSLLYNEAQSRGWKVVVERKDVIYVL